MLLDVSCCELFSLGIRTLPQIFYKLLGVTTQLESEDGSKTLLTKHLCVCLARLLRAQNDKIWYGFEE